MNRQIAVALKLTGLLTLLFGLIYPLLITAFGQLIFSVQANGSLVERDGRVIGSSFIGQQFVGAEYLHPRPSAAGQGYDATASGGSNLGPTSKALYDRIRDDVSKLRKENPGLPKNLPADMVTASASGLDPDISPANAYLQAPRISGARGISEGKVLGLIRRNIVRPQFGFIGEPRVNVLLVNLSLDEAAPIQR